MEIGWGRSVPRECVMITSYHTPRSVSFSLRHLKTPPWHGGQGPVQLRDFPPSATLVISSTAAACWYSCASWVLAATTCTTTRLLSPEPSEMWETLVPMLFLHTLGFPFQTGGSHSRTKMRIRNSYSYICRLAAQGGRTSSMRTWLN